MTNHITKVYFEEYGPDGLTRTYTQEGFNQLQIMRRLISIEARLAKMEERNRRSTELEEALREVLASVLHLDPSFGDNEVLSRARALLNEGAPMPTGSADARTG